MAVYSLPAEFEAKLPRLDFTKLAQYNQDVEKFLAELAAWAKKRNPDQNLVGEVIQYPVADGYAQYLVAATKPVQLIHLPLGDAWHYEGAKRINKKAIEENVQRQRALKSYF